MDRWKAGVRCFAVSLHFLCFAGLNIYEIINDFQVCSKLNELTFTKPVMSGVNRYGPRVRKFIP
jgi:hypothetical protein